MWNIIILMQMMHLNYSQKMTLLKISIYNRLLLNIL